MIAFVGVAITMFSKKPKVKNVGQIIASLGVLFIGLGTMSAAMKPLAGEVWFQSLLQKFSNPILCVIYGVIFTVIIQSASASVGVLQMLALSGVMAFPGAFPQAFYIMLGMNNGASVAPALASLGGRKDAKRVAFIVILFESYWHGAVHDTYADFPGYLRLDFKYSSGKSDQTDCQCQYDFQPCDSSDSFAMCEISG